MSMIQLATFLKRHTTELYIKKKIVIYILNKNKRLRSWQTIVLELDKKMARKNKEKYVFFVLSKFQFKLR